MLRPLGRFGNEEEHSVITSVERESQIAHGRAPRDSYDGFPYRTQGTLSVAAAIPQAEQFIQKIAPHLQDATLRLERFNVDMADPPTPIEGPSDPAYATDGGKALGYRDGLIRAGKHSLANS